MDIFILRHGEAFPNAPSDAQRELTPQGCKRVEQVVHQHLLDKKINIETIIVSPLVRAQQTASIAKTVLHFNASLETTDFLLPEASPIELLNFIASKTITSVLLVSHLPLVGDLLSVLIDGNAHSGMHLPTAGLAYVQAEYAAPSMGKLMWVH